MWQVFTHRPNDSIHLSLGTRMCDKYLQPDPMTRHTCYLVLECVTSNYTQKQWQDPPFTWSWNVWQSFTTTPHDKIHLLLGPRMCDNHLQPDPMTRNTFYVILECVTIIYNQTPCQYTPFTWSKNVWQSFTTSPHDKAHILRDPRMCDNHLQPDLMTRSTFYVILECVTIIYNQTPWQDTPFTWF